MKPAWNDALWRVRYALRVAAAIPVGLLLPWILALRRDDPLWGTMQIAPVILVALWQLEIWAEDRGGRARSFLSRVVDGGGLLTWILLVPLRSTAGLQEASPVLAAALFAGLGWRVYRLLPRLRPALGRRLGPFPPTPFFWLPLVVYVAILPWSLGQRAPDGDEPYYLLVAHSLAYDGDADLGNNYLRQDSRRFMERALEPQPGDPVGPEGQLYSRHNVLLPLLLAIPYRLAGVGGAAGVLAVLAAALSWWFLRAVRQIAPDRPGEALLAWALLAFTPPLLLYSHQIWVEVPAALLLLVGWELASVMDGSRPRLRIAGLLLVGTLLILLKLRFAVLAVPLLVMALIRGSRRLWALGALGVFGVATLLVLGYNQVRFGNALKTFSMADLDLFGHPPAEYLLAGSGLLFDAAFGLFAVAPLWLLLIPAVVVVVRREPALVGRLAFLVGPYVLLLASRAEWYGGWSPPFRYGLVALPLAALLLPPLLAGRHRSGARALLAALTALTGAATLVWLAIPGWTYNLADGGTHLADALARALNADVNRLLPSMVRPRLATWLWPAFAAVLATVLWRRPRRRSAPAAPLAVGLVLAGFATAPLLAMYLPTRIVELEDPPVSTVGGRLHPGPWTLARVRFPSGVVLPEGSRLSVPIVPGGDEVEIRIRLHGIPNDPHPVRLVVDDGERTFHRGRFPVDTDWRELVAGPVPWHPGRELHVAVEDPPPSGASRNGVVIDRMELEWR